MIEYIAAVFFLLITPGPGVLSTAGVGASYGARAGTAYVAGLFIGNNLVVFAVISGLAAALLAFPFLVYILAALSTAYLVYLALKIAFSGRKLGFIHPDKEPNFWNGVALQPINPKAYAVATALFSNFPLAGFNDLAEVLIKIALFNAIWIPIHFIWLAAGLSIQRMNLPPRTQSLVNILMALSMLVVVALAVYVQIASS